MGRRARPKLAPPPGVEPTGRVPHRQGPLCVDIPDDLLGLLGRIPDPDIARWAGCGAETIRRRRIALGIAACGDSRQPTISRERVAEFADRGWPDSAIAATLETSPLVVERIRHEWGILRTPRRPAGQEWRERNQALVMRRDMHELEMLDHVLRVVAELGPCTIRAVSERLRSEGLPSDGKLVSRRLRALAALGGVEHGEDGWRAR